MKAVGSAFLEKAATLYDRHNNVFTRLNVNFMTAAILEKKPAPNQIKFSSKSFLRKGLHTASCNTLPGGIYNIAKFPESNLYALQELLQ